MTLQLYVDDSGKNDPPVFVLAGFVAKTESWVEFSREWSACLSQTPQIDHLKMKDANRRQGCFKGITSEERDKRLHELTEIIAKYIEVGVSIAIPHDVYSKVFQGKMMKAFDTPYALTFYLIQAATHKYLSLAGNEESVDLVYDRQLDQEDQLLEAHASTQRGLPDQVLARFPTPPIFSDDKQAMPLQAADLLAWHIRRSWRDGRDRLPQLSAAGSVLQKMPLINEIWLEKDLNYLLEIGMAKITSMNTLPPHKARDLKQTFDMLATMANIEVLEVALPFVPIEMVSFPAIGMEKYLFVRSCATCDNPHLHKRLENRCLSEQTAVGWPLGSRS